MIHSLRRLRLTAACAIVSIGILGGCATNGDSRDPLEPLNRGVYKFNEGVDTMLLKPAAEVYQGVVPPVARTGVSNVFSNLNDVVVALNNLLQGKVTKALSDVGRVLINTTAGLFGIFDVATPSGLEKHDEDFGQTLGYWGVGDGPYLVLPFFGPRNLRDAAGSFVDFKADPLQYLDPAHTRNQLWALRLVSRRTELLSASKLLSVAALDEYEFTRDAYLQRRHNLVHDGNPPREARDKNTKLDVRPLVSTAPAAEPAKVGEVKAEEISGNTPEAPVGEEAAQRPDEVSQSTSPAAVAVLAAESAPVVRVRLP